MPRLSDIGFARRRRCEQAVREAISAAALRLALEQGPGGLKLVRVSDIASAAPEPDRAGLAMIMSTPELQGEALKAFTMAEEPLAIAIAERTASDPRGNLSCQVMAAAIAGAVRVAGRHWLSTTAPPSFAAVLRDALRHILPTQRPDQGSVSL